MPFITEEIWHQLRAQETDCVVSGYPKAGDFDAELIKKVEKAKDLVSSIRELRSSKGIKAKEELELSAANSASAKALFTQNGLEEMVVKMAFLSNLTLTDSEPDNAFSFLSGTEKYFLESNQTIDVEAEKAKIQKDLEYQKGFVASVMKKLGNERFVNNAPDAVVANERKKLADGEAKIQILEEQLAKLG